MQAGTPQAPISSRSYGRPAFPQRTIVAIEAGRPQGPGLPKRELEARDDLIRIIRENRGRSSALISVLHDVQNSLGHIPLWAQLTVSQEMGIPFSTVHGVVTFYNFFSQQPKGRHTIQICQGTACYVRGGRRILQQLARRLGVRPGETTKDGSFSLEIVRCLGCCGLAPVISIDGKVYRRMNPKKAAEILEGYN